MSQTPGGDELVRKNAEILQRAWSDASFRDRLKRAPGETLAESGILVSQGTEIVVLEDTPGLSHLVLPALDAGRATSPATSMAGTDSPFLRALADPQARRRLVEAPRETLRSMGFAPAEGVEIRVVENAPGKAYLVLPLPPAEGEVSDEELVSVSGGTMIGVAATVVTVISAAGASAVATAVSVAASEYWRRKNA